VSDTPTFASSITTASGPTEGPVMLADLSHLAKLVVKTTPARPAGLGPVFGSSEVVGEALVCGSRPGEWLVLGSEQSVEEVVAGLAAHIVDLTHGRALIQIAGESSAATLEKLCSLDWTDRMMPDGAVASASVAKVSCDVIRHDHEGRPAYLVAADRSFGQYLYEAFADAAAEFATT